MASIFDYEASKIISKNDPPFAALVFALIRKADSNNIEKIRMCWPGLYDEFLNRYNAPGGYLPGEEPTKKGGL